MADVKNKTVNIYIDQAAAVQALETLQKSADKLTQKIEEGRQAGKSMVAEIKKLDETKAAIAGVQDQVDKSLKPSFAQTAALVTKLRNELKRMSEDAPGYAEKFNAFQKARTELDRLGKAMNGVEKAQTSWLQEAKVIAFGVLIGNTVQSAVQAIAGYFSGIISGNAKMSDSLADVQRVAGLTGKEVQDLNKKLAGFDTRTGVDQLRQIAIVAGKLGVAKDDIASFTKSVDQLVVALGDELGNADQITTTLGKILNVFDGKVTGENILQLGNAFVVLANAGVASGGFIADFTQRVSGIAKASGLSLGATVGLGAGLEELGGKVESSSTAIQKLVTTIGADIPKAAKIAGATSKQQIQEFANLFARAPEEAILKFAEGLTKNKAAFSEISASFKDAGEDGARTVSTLIQLGEKADFFREKMDLGRKSIADTSAITDAFNLKNQTLGAELDKLGKKFTSFIQSKTLSDFFRSSVSAASSFIDVLKALPNFIANNRTAIGLLITGIALMNSSYILAAIVTTKDSVAKAYNAVVTRLTAAATTATIAVQAAYITITTLLTGQITLATAAQRLWNIALSVGAGPLGILVVAAGALVAVVGNLIGATKTLSVEQKIQADLQTRMTNDIGEQKSKTFELLALAKDVNLEYSLRKQALDALIKQNPEYLQGLTLENINTQKGISLIDEYIQAIDRMAKAKALRGIKEDLAKQRLSQDIDLKVQGKNAAEEGFVSKAIGNVFGTGDNAKYTKTLIENVEATQKFNATTEVMNQEVAKLNFSITAQESKLKNVKKGTEEYTKAQRDLNAMVKERNIYLGLSNSSADVTASGDVPVNYQPDKAAEKKAKKEESEREKLLKQLKDFQFELTLVGKQADESEIDRITKKYNELTVKAARYGLSVIEIEKEKSRAVAYLIDQEDKKRKDAIDKINHAADEETYKNFQESIALQGEQQKEADTKKYAAGLLTKREYEEAFRRTDIETYDFRIALAESFAGRSKQAATDVVVFKKAKNKQELADAVATREHLLELEKREDLAKAQLGVLQTRPDTKARLDAQLNLLKIERDNELKNTELTDSEKEKINEEYRQKAGQATIQFYAQQVEQTLGFLKSGLDIISKLNDARASKEKAALDKELKNNDVRRASIKKLEESKVISSGEAARRLTAIQVEEDKKKEELDKKQQARAKRIAIAQAVINGALAITSTLAAIPGPIDILSLGAARSFQIGLAIATTLAEIDTISNTKYGKGGRLTGPSHSDGGMPVINPVTGRKEAEVEGGEYILSKSTVANNREIADALLHSSMHRSGMRIAPFWQSRPYRSLDYSGISSSMQKVKFATGGVFHGKPAGDDQPGATSTDPALLEMLRQQQLINAAMINSVDNLNSQIASGIQASVSLRQLEDAQKEKRRIYDNTQFK